MVISCLPWQFQYSMLTVMLFDLNNGNEMAAQTATTISWA